MKLKGKRVLLSRPVIEKSAIEISPEVQESLDRENMKKWTNLEVFAVGELVETIKVGDKVYVPKGALERCDVVDVNNEVKLMISDFDVAIVW
jgi:uncharacterized paraquat-inducible protein A